VKQDHVFFGPFRLLAGVIEVVENGLLCIQRQIAQLDGRMIVVVCVVPGR
jgi:hypothetical protein